MTRHRQHRHQLHQLLLTIWLLLLSIIVLLLRFDDREVVVLLGAVVVLAFSPPPSATRTHHHYQQQQQQEQRCVSRHSSPVPPLQRQRYHHHHPSNHLNMASLGDYTVELEKPLGIILEECGDDSGRSGGVRVKELTDSGSAATCTSVDIVPGDVLLQVNDINVEKSEFDDVMDLLIGSSSPISLTFGDGLGIMDMPKNVVKQIKETQDLFLVDAVVRKAVREIRKNGILGDLLKVEIIIGAGVTPQQEEGDSNDKKKNTKKKRVMVRFFAIFSTDGVSTYSCNVSATGIVTEEVVEDGTSSNNRNIEIVSLSCAKDEGLGRAFDLI